mmetsp:Transcript_36700/g.88102  ORF Transcript_36700/g.88102 Transcript_36700/m.88102 type:complete len:202 (-) Transcript_36700:1474-2079(-)
MEEHRRLLHVGLKAADVVLVGRGHGVAQRAERGAVGVADRYLALGVTREDLLHHGILAGAEEHAQVLVQGAAVLLEPAVGRVEHLARVVRDDEGNLGELGDALVRDRLALDLVAVLADARLAEDGRALVRFVEHADHLADVGLLVTLGHEALLVEHGVDRALVAIDELDLQLVVGEVDVRARDALALVVLLLPLDEGVGEV